MRDAQPQTIHLVDYQPPAYAVERTELHFELFDDHALVHASLEFARTASAAQDAPLILNGVDLETLQVAIDGEEVSEGALSYREETLEISGVPARGRLQTRVRIRPQDNTSLEGLYRSRGLFCTQCEAEGFRKITWFPDRPDVMSIFRVTVDACSTQCPVLLSNGNLVEGVELPGGRHRAVWDDPFPKPSYLFALVAGDLERVEDRFITCSGREVRLVILVEEKDLPKTAHAMESLKRAMRWDEERFGREYDLDVFHIVAVDDFNMGAMENKSLNIFNTSCVLASPETTTDLGYQRIESIVGHEYFHNWSGNRVTCRDWFQLSLKEGFTVFRDAEFSADMGSAALKRVEDAVVMRTLQFAEDAGPMAHPIRPASFIEISNFYTLTVYEKGAEVVRMLQTLLGREAFRAGSDLYFERHDGQAVTCDEFVAAMEEASGVDLTQFRRWYSQAGTPELTVRDRWDEAAGVYHLDIRQHTPPTPGQEEKEPLVIPLAMGLLGEAGNLRVSLEGDAADFTSEDNTQRVLIVDRESQSFSFRGLPEKPVPSLLRGFSAPVRVDYPYSREDLLALASRDDDGFVRWDAMQQLMVTALQELQELPREVSTQDLDPMLAAAVAAIVADPGDPAIAADMLRLPSESYLAELAAHGGGVDPLAIHRARETLRRQLALAYGDRWRELFEAQRVREGYAASGEQIGRRALAGVALDYAATASSQGVELAASIYREADNLTERLLALRCLMREASDDECEAAIDDFYRRFGQETLALNHWLQLQAESPRGDALERVRGLMRHPAYDRRNPNKIRAVVGGFSNLNTSTFHREDGAGYAFLAEVVAELNEVNPQIASRLLTPLTRWRNYPQGGVRMREELQRLSELPSLSRDVYEVVSKSLAGVEGG
ncbi:MAG: aminopeptidase N [Halieaceae bacterium]|jgi:aminopeptidase N|nr:aminopeptidase N [Halieaceae bacterium]